MELCDCDLVIPIFFWWFCDALDRAISWFAVGCYYYCIRQFDHARRYFWYAWLHLVSCISILLSSPIGLNTWRLHPADINGERLGYKKPSFHHVSSWVSDVMMLKWHFHLQVSLETLPCITDTKFYPKPKHCHSNIWNILLINGPSAAKQQLWRVPLHQPGLVLATHMLLKMRVTRLWLPIEQLRVYLQGIVLLLWPSDILFPWGFILSYISWAQHTISCIHTSHNRLTSLFRCISSDASACLLVASLHYFAMVCSCHLPALCIGMEYLRTNNLNLAEQVSAYSTFPHLDSLNFTSSRVSDFCCICCKNDILMHVL